MLNALTKSPLARVGVVAALLVAGTAASSAAPLPVMTQPVLAASTATAAPTDIRYVRHYYHRPGRAFAGAALGILGLGLGAALTGGYGGPCYGYPYSGYCGPSYYPYYGPTYYGYYPHGRRFYGGGFIGHRGFAGHGFGGHGFAGRHFGHRR